MKSFLTSVAVKAAAIAMSVMIAAGGSGVSAMAGQNPKAEDITPSDIISGIGEDFDEDRIIGNEIFYSSVSAYDGDIEGYIEEEYLGKDIVISGTGSESEDPLAVYLDDKVRYKPISGVKLTLLYEDGSEVKNFSGQNVTGVTGKDGSFRLRLSEDEQNKAHISHYYIKAEHDDYYTEYIPLTYVNIYKFRTEYEEYIEKEVQPAAAALCEFLNNEFTEDVLRTTYENVLEGMEEGERSAYMEEYPLTKLIYVREETLEASEQIVNIKWDEFWETVDKSVEALRSPSFEECLEAIAEAIPDRISGWGMYMAMSYPGVTEETRQQLFAEGRELTAGHFWEDEEFMTFVGETTKLIVEFILINKGIGALAEFKSFYSGLKYSRKFTVAAKELRLATEVKEGKTITSLKMVPTKITVGLFELTPEEILANLSKLSADEVVAYAAMTYADKYSSSIDDILKTIGEDVKFKTRLEEAMKTFVEANKAGYELIAGEELSAEAIERLCSEIDPKAVKQIVEAALEKCEMGVYEEIGDIYIESITNEEGRAIMSSVISDMEPAQMVDIGTVYSTYCARLIKERNALAAAAGAREAVVATVIGNGKNVIQSIINGDISMEEALAYEKPISSYTSRAENLAAMSGTEAERELALRKMVSTHELGHAIIAEKSNMPSPYRIEFIEVYTTETGDNDAFGRVRIFPAFSDKNSVDQLLHAEQLLGSAAVEQTVHGKVEWAALKDAEDAINAAVKAMGGNREKAMDWLGKKYGQMLKDFSAYKKDGTLDSMACDLARDLSYRDDAVDAFMEKYGIDADEYYYVDRSEGAGDLTTWADYNTYDDAAYYEQYGASLQARLDKIDEAIQEAEVMGDVTDVIADEVAWGPDDVLIDSEETRAKISGVLEKLSLDYMSEYATIFENVRTVFPAAVEAIESATADKFCLHLNNNGDSAQFSNLTMYTERLRDSCKDKFGDTFQVVISNHEQGHIAAAYSISEDIRPVLIHETMTPDNSGTGGTGRTGGTAVYEEENYYLMDIYIQNLEKKGYSHEDAVKIFCFNQTLLGIGSSVEELILYDDVSFASYVDCSIARSRYLKPMVDELYPYLQLNTRNFLVTALAGELKNKLMTLYTELNNKDIIQGANDIVMEYVSNGETIIPGDVLTKYYITAFKDGNVGEIDWYNSDVLNAYNALSTEKKDELETVISEVYQSHSIDRLNNRILNAMSIRGGIMHNAEYVGALIDEINRIKVLKKAKEALDETSLTVEKGYTPGSLTDIIDSLVKNSAAFGIVFSAPVQYEYNAYQTKYEGKNYACMTRRKESAVEGRVLDSDTGKAIDGATLNLFKFEDDRLSNVGGEPSGSVISMEMGNYRMTGLEKGGYRLEATAEGYESAVYTFTIGNNEVLSQDFMLVKSKTASSGDDDDSGEDDPGQDDDDDPGNPDGNDDDPDDNGNTDDDDPGNPGGNDDPGTPGGQGDPGNQGGNDDPQTPGGQDDEHENETTTGNIDGLVVDAESGNPLKGAKIILKRNKNSMAVSVVYTDEKGSYLIRNIEEGPYIVTAEKDGYESGTVNVTAVRNATEAADTIKLEPQCAMSGKITDGDGKGIAGAEIILEPTSGDRGDTRKTVKVKTDSDGHYSAEIRHGNYTAEVLADGYRTVTRTIEADGREKTADFVLERKEFTVRFTLQDSDGNAGKNKEVSVCFGPDGKTVKASSDENGFVSLTYETGEYKLSIYYDNSSSKQANRIYTGEVCCDVDGGIVNLGTIRIPLKSHLSIRNVIGSYSGEDYSRYYLATVYNSEGEMVKRVTVDSIQKGCADSFDEYLDPGIYTVCICETKSRGGFRNRHFYWSETMTLEAGEQYVIDTVEVEEWCMNQVLKAYSSNIAVPVTFVIYSDEGKEIGRQTALPEKNKKDGGMLAKVTLPEVAFGTYWVVLESTEEGYVPYYYTYDTVKQLENGQYAVKVTVKDSGELCTGALVYLKCSEISFKDSYTEDAVSGLKFSCEHPELQYLLDGIGSDGNGTYKMQFPAEEKVFFENETYSGSFNFPWSSGNAIKRISAKSSVTINVINGAGYDYHSTLHLMRGEKVVLYCYKGINKQNLPPGEYTLKHRDGHKIINISVSADRVNEYVINITYKDGKKCVEVTLNGVPVSTGLSVEMEGMSEQSDNGSGRTSADAGTCEPENETLMGAPAQAAPVTEENPNGGDAYEPIESIIRADLANFGGTLKFWPFAPEYGKDSVTVKQSDEYNDTIKRLEFILPAIAVVYAADDGTVVYSGYTLKDGNGIIIDLGNGTYLEYTGLSLRNVAEDEEVEAGERIGLTGIADEDGSTFLLGILLSDTGWENGLYICPEPYLFTAGFAAH